MLLGKYTKFMFLVLIFTPHAQRERGKVIGVGVCTVHPRLSEPRLSESSIIRTPKIIIFIRF